ncbi:putative methyltransferase pmt16 [Quercus suber]|uniref:Methyltransferase n=1 Tax=Quercus suber TaxID=58331 RepID=A0AAW0KY04_QUESU
MPFPMANPSTPSYHPTSKPSKSNTISSFFSWKSTNLYSLVVFLCIISYLLGSWKHSMPTIPTAKNQLASKDCLNIKNNNTPLDFNPHHNLNDSSLSPSLPNTHKSYPPCNVRYSEYTPCEDAKRSLRFNRDRLIYRERHCPEKSETLKCRIPAPFGYKNPFAWPTSRDLVWYANVPHKELTVEKAVQNWIRYEGEKFRFPGGGTMFPNGADAYIDDIAKLINLNDGSIRTAIDTGCGVASWGAYLLSRNIMTMSFAPRDTHEAQVQFALERGVPALIGIIASKRIPYPSRAFDMAHCSRCLIPWGQYNGLYLIEVDRVLRPGGYTEMETCLTPLPEVSNNQEIAGGELEKWPERLYAIPPRISRGTVKGVTAEIFQKDAELWSKRVSYYKNVNSQLGQAGRYRNVLDMNAYLGGFAASLIEYPLWVMNVVPAEAKVNTLGVIYERGLIGTYQNWCEAMSTYPRTYDLIHADSVFSLYKDRCEMEDILLEMDRVLRPEGSVIFRDDVDNVIKIKNIIDGLDWDSQIVDHEDGPHHREKLLFAVKKYWTAPAATKS